MKRRVDVAVVGAGVMGLAAARVLRGAGHDVLCFEQFQLGHRHGSSHGTSRIFRLAYDNPEYVRLAREALPLWRRLEREAGEALLIRTGSLDVGGDLQAFHDTLTASGVDAELMDAGETLRTFPELRLPDAAVLHHQDGGVLLADRALRALARGVELAEDTRVLGLLESDGQVALETSRGAFQAGVVIVAAGAWAANLVGLPVEVTRETVVHFRLTEPAFPPTLIDHTAPAGRASQAFYALASPEVGLKAGLHRSGVQAGADTQGPADPAVLELVADWVRARYDLAEPEPALVETCLYTSTEEERFIVERRGRIVVCSACSGHGFKFAPAVGERVAELARAALAN